MQTKRFNIINNRMKKFVNLYVNEFTRSETDRKRIPPMQMHGMILNKCMGSLNESDKKFMFASNPKYDDFVSYSIISKLENKYDYFRMAKESKSMFERSMTAFFADMDEDNNDEEE